MPEPRRLIRCSRLLALSLFLGLAAALPASTPNTPKDTTMSPNKRTVQTYMEAFGRLDHAAVLACLTEDVEWILPGAYHHKGKAAFDKEIENDAFTGRPVITVTRLIEEQDLVVAEGSVRATRKDGVALNLAFCDVFEMRRGKIRRLISYLMAVQTP